MDTQGTFFELPFDVGLWEEYGRNLKQKGFMSKWEADRRQWAIGDWLATGEKHLKSSAQLWRQGTKVTGYPRGTLKNLLWMARELPASRRRDKLLSWSHLKFFLAPVLLDI